MQWCSKVVDHSRMNLLRTIGFLICLQLVSASSDFQTQTSRYHHATANSLLKYFGYGGVLLRFAEFDLHLAVYGLEYLAAVGSSCAKLRMEMWIHASAVSSWGLNHFGFIMQKLFPSFEEPWQYSPNVVQGPWPGPLVLSQFVSQVSSQLMLVPGISASWGWQVNNDYIYKDVSYIVHLSSL